MKTIKFDAKKDGPIENLRGINCKKLIIKNWRFLNKEDLFSLLNHIAYPGVMMYSKGKIVLK